MRTLSEGKLHWEKASSLLATEFAHTSSRLTRAPRSQAACPIPSFTPTWSCSVPTWRPPGSAYRFRLDKGPPISAEGLRELGLQVEGGTGKDGRYFEVAGVPGHLAERWSMRGVEIERAARVFRARYGRDPCAGELGSLTVTTRGTKAELKPGEVDRAWKAVGDEHGLSREQAQSLYTAREREPFSHERFGRALIGKLTEHSATVSERDMRARAYELIAGQAHPREADVAIEALTRSGELIALQDNRWTTRELRELELRTLQLAASRASETAAPVSEASLRHARLKVQREIRGQLSAEQREAVRTITGRGGLSVLVGQAGTGKGVVIAAAAGAWQREGHQVIGTAVAGATAERLGADATLEHSITTDALLARVQSGGVHLDAKTVVVMDEAGTTDTKRLAALAEVTARAESKLVLVGDHAQLPAIGAGGMFAELQRKVPTAEVSEVHRARHAWERDAWQQVRAGEAHRALASYQAHGRLHIADTRERAAERMVEAWDRARQERPDERLVMLTDASNAELDRINALAQERRAQAGELGARSVELPDRPYGLAAGDQVSFTAALYQPGQPRVENGTLGSVVEVSGSDCASVQTAGAQDREIHLGAQELAGLRLANAQHLYKAQGRTVDRSFVLTGGWQADREGAYVALTRAQERTDLYVSRRDLGEQGMDAGAIERLGEAMAESRAQEASVVVALERQHPRELTTEAVADSDRHGFDASLENEACARGSG